MDWYYCRNGSQQQGPIDRSRLQTLIDRGELGGDDLVWREGLGDWQALARVSEFQLPSGVRPDNPYAVGRAAELGQLVGGGYDKSPWQPLIDNAKWIKFLGVMLMISGIFGALYLIGIPYIFAGLWVMKAADRLRLLDTAPSAETAREISGELGKTFKLLGIMTIIGLVLYLAIIVFYIFLFAAFASAGVMSM